MMKSITRIFWRSSVSSSLSAAVNLIVGLFIIRFIGSDAYSSQIVDLAKIAIVMLMADILPSSFAVFKIQDDVRWRDIALLHTAISLIAIPTFIGVVTLSFDVFDASGWLISICLVSLLMKRFNDLHLQAIGQIDQLFRLDFLTSIIRLVLLLILFALGADGELTVWLSLNLAGLIAQAYGIYILRGHIGSFQLAVSSDRWAELRTNMRTIISYYPVIGLKRVADSLVPLLAERIFISKDTLALFLLGFRGIYFVSVFIRIFETLLNHRGFLAHFQRGGVWIHASLLAGLSQLAAFMLSAAMVLMSGLLIEDWTFLFFLSAAAWPLTFISIRRARDYAGYRVIRVGASYAIYIFAQITLVYILVIYESADLGWFSLVYLVAKMLSLIL